MGGRPILSCTALAIECDGATIETSEGIANAGHPLIEAYIKHQCMQCGYCTPGFMCTAKALLDRNPNPTTDQIQQALAGNLCRCSTYLAHSASCIGSSCQTLREAVSMVDIYDRLKAEDLRQLALDG